MSFGCGLQPEGMPWVFRLALFAANSNDFVLQPFLDSAPARAQRPAYHSSMPFGLARRTSSTFVPRAPFFLLVGVYLAAASCSSTATAPHTPQATAEPQATPRNAGQPPTKAYLGADLNTYPGDTALPILRKTFSFVSYWLSAPPDAKGSTWLGKRELLQSQGFGLAVLYLGPPSKALKSPRQSEQKAIGEAKNAAAAAAKEGFPVHTIIFLDIEEGGRLPATYHAYLRAWTDELTSAGYRAGVYCSGMPVNEGGGVTILTSDDIRNNIGSREMQYWIFNDACPPSPGCVVSQNPPPPSASGVAYAAIWQISQSPRRKQYTAHCAATYGSDGNCYAPGDAAHKWFLDINSATSPDPSRK